MFVAAVERGSGFRREERKEWVVFFILGVVLYSMHMQICLKSLVPLVPADRARCFGN